MLKIKAKKKRDHRINIYFENDLDPQNYVYVLVALIIKLSGELSKFFTLENVEELHGLIMGEIRKEAKDGDK